MGARLEAVLEGLLEPVPEDRMPAEEAAAILSGKPRPARREAGRAGGGVGGQNQRQSHLRSRQRQLYGRWPGLSVR